MTITCVGDCGIDHYTTLGLSRPGGITLNFAVHAKSLFSIEDKIQIVSVLGTGTQSHLIESVIKERGIIPHINKVEGKTPVQNIDLDNNGEKIFTKYDAGILENYSITDEQKQFVEESDFAMTVVFKQIESFFQSVIMLNFKGLVAVDFMDLADYDKKTDVVKKFIKYFDIAFFGLQKEETELIKKLQNLAKINKKLFVITLGPDGSTAQDQNNLYYQPAVLVEKFKDSTGAGDAFAAAFIKTYLYTKNIELSLKEGNNYAASIIQKVGSF